jgi:NADPH-dependent 2,4-dienoyl-CoA reductase/sulfur reductase-like enzyme
MSLKRRTILQMFPAAAALSMAPLVRAQTPHRVMVIGGGFAGATVAKYIRMWSHGTVGVTLVEPRVQHVSCIMSNLVLNRQLTIPELSFDYETLQGRYGVEVIQDRVTRISDAGPEIELMDGGWIPYDSLVVATGIQFDAVAGLNDASKTPHAWIAGAQTVVLRNQIEAIPAGGTFVMSIPDKPYRCPPGPYERACLVADLLRDRGGRVIVLDANNGIQAERETFTRAFNELYAGIVDYRPLERVEAIDQASNTVYTKRLNADGGEIGDGMAQGDVVNIIPRHGAPQLLQNSGLTDGGRWAPVNPITYGSTLEKFPNVYIIGDSQATGQPKSGHMANAQAKVCADAIVRRAAQMPVDSEERLASITTNSACFSPINASEASWLTAVFAYNQETGTMGLVPGSLGEAHEWNSENYRDMFSWSRNLFSDTFM